MDQRSHTPGAREQRLVAMLHSMSRALSGAATLPAAIGEVTEAARDLIEFERVAVLLLEADGSMTVHASVSGVAWTEGRHLAREHCSPRLWIEPTQVDRIRDAALELDPTFPMDREIVERGTRSILRAPLNGRGGPLGWLVFGAPSADLFDEADEATASAIASLVSMALEHERLLSAEVRRRSRLAAVDSMLPELGQGHELSEIALELSRRAQGILPHDALAVGVIHAGGALLHVVEGAAGGTSFEVPPAFLQTQIAGLATNRSLLVREIEIVDAPTRRVRLHYARGEHRFEEEGNVPEEAYQLRARLGIRSQLRVGVHRGEQLDGMLVFSSRTPDHFGLEDVEIGLRLAERVSLRLAQERIENEARRAGDSLERAKALEARVEALQRELESARARHAVVGVSRSWRQVLAHAAQVAKVDTTVLLTGESGTGKEVVARFIHHASKRADGPFLALNCAALPEQLLEAELFGHEKGAFTGAGALRLGRIEQAKGGLLFLDEVGEMSASLQAKFLRVLQEREFQRLGGSATLSTDVRVVAATNRDLAAAIRRGDFREDLFYRLNVFAINLPPLRERPEDVLALAEHFLKELGPALGDGDPGLTPAARTVLREYRWPGNVRELRNAIERALILADGGLIQPEHLAFAPSLRSSNEPPTAPTELDRLPPDGIDLEAMERGYVQCALAQAAGNKSKAARLLGLTRAQLYTRLEKYSL